MSSLRFILLAYLLGIVSSVPVGNEYAVNIVARQDTAVVSTASSLDATSTVHITSSITVTASSTVTVVITTAESSNIDASSTQSHHPHETKAASMMCPDGYSREELIILGLDIIFEPGYDFNKHGHSHTGSWTGSSYPSPTGSSCRPRPTTMSSHKSKCSSDPKISSSWMDKGPPSATEGVSTDALSSVQSTTTPTATDFPGLPTDALSTGTSPTAVESSATSTADTTSTQSSDAQSTSI